MKSKEMDVEREFAKKGLELFKQYLKTIYCVSYDTFLSWENENQEDALKDFFGKK